MTDTASALDWAEDYDIFDRRFVQDPYPITAELLVRRWRTPALGWLVAAHRYEDIQTIAHDVEHFSSVEIAVAPIPATYDEHGNRRRSVIASDPPEHTPERRILPILLAQGGAARRRRLCNRFIDGFIADGRVDAAERAASCRLHHRPHLDIG
ncbi:MAG: hypothetical protein R2749_15715 [Acidimicrobiales bacterium]